MSVIQSPSAVQRFGDPPSPLARTAVSAAPGYGTIPVGPAPHSIAMRPDGLRAYVANSGADTLSVIDTAAGVVTTNVSVGAGPWDVTVTPDGQFVYVSEPGGGRVGVVSTATNALVGTVSGLTVPQGLAVTPDGARIYVANSGAHTVSVISTATNTVTGTITVGNNPDSLTIRPDGLRAYVTNSADGTVSVINTLTNTVVTTMTGFNAPLDAVVTPDGTQLYGANSGARTVSVISTATNTVTGTITLAHNPTYLSVSPDGTLLYATMSAAGSLAVINPSTNTVTRTLPGFVDPHEVATTPDSRSTFVVNHGNGTVGVLRRPASLSPNQGPRGGGTTVTITGRGFLGTTAVHFGIRRAKSFTVVSDTELIAVAPSAGIRSSVPVTVTAGGGTAVIGHYYYRRLSQLASISASSGPTSGGNVLTLTGHGFTGVSQVGFGTVMAKANVLSDTQLSVTVPPSALARTVAVHLVGPGGSSNSLSYTYIGAATITSISPTSGPRTGSRIVNLNGVFLSQVNSVRFGGVPALSFKVMSDIKVQSVTPPGTPGSVPVTVTTTTGATATSPMPYTYT
ncbi:IPT/TIG domain-containing protein [Streptomyces lydicamycinicus]